MIGPTDFVFLATLCMLKCPSSICWLPARELNGLIRVLQYLFNGAYLLVSATFQSRCTYLFSFTLSLAQQPNAGQGRLILGVFRSHNDTPVGRPPLGEGSARHRGLYLHTTQHSQETDIHAPGGIQTRNPSKRLAADPRLRPLGFWDDVTNYDVEKFILFYGTCRFIHAVTTAPLGPIQSPHIHFFFNINLNIDLSSARWSARRYYAFRIFRNLHTHFYISMHAAVSSISSHLYLTARVVSIIKMQSSP